MACMLDLFTREIVGWAIDSHMRKSLVHDALKMAELKRIQREAQSQRTQILFGQRQPIRCVRHSKLRATDGLPAVDERQGQLLRQCADGELLA